LQGVLNVLYLSLGWIEQFAASLPANAETEDLRLVQVDLWWDENSVREMFQENMRQTCPEISSVNIHASKLWKIYLFTPWAINLEPRCFQGVAEANGQHLLLIAESSWTEAIHT